MTKAEITAAARAANKTAHRHLFLDSGFLDWEPIMDIPEPFVFIIGGRGTGKTYGGLQSIYKRIRGTTDQFLYLRRSKSQLTDIVSTEFNPFGAINRDTGSHVMVGPATATFDGFYEGKEDKDGKWVVSGAPIGYAVAVSTAQNVRGLERSEIKYILYDEFIKLDSEKAFKGEAAAFLYLYETVNRNRELDGYPPIKAFLCANSNRLDNALFLELGLISVVERMRKKGQIIHQNPDRGIAIIDLPAEGPISQAKAHTALYKLASGTEYADMALKNSYNYDDSDIKPQNLSDYTPWLAIGELCIYRHKAARLYYCTTHRSGTPESYEWTDKDLRRVVQLYFGLGVAYIRHQVLFETYTCEALFKRIFT